MAAEFHQRRKEVRRQSPVFNTFMSFMLFMVTMG